MNVRSQTGAAIPAGRRGRSRLRTNLPARIVTLYGTFTVIMEDISLTGARVQIMNRRGKESLPRRKSSLMLEWFDFDAFGEVSWIEKGRIGMKFEKIIPPDVLIQTRDLGDANMASLKARDELRNYMRDWSQGLVR